MKRKKGFTLIELLVVIAIIALLLSIIIPSLKKAKEHAREIFCKNNLKQYGTACFMYRGDYDDKFPWVYYWLHIDPPAKAAADGTPLYCMWHNEDIEPDGQLWPYLEAGKINLCPVLDSLARSGKADDHVNCPVPMKPQFSYSMNSYLGAGMNEIGYNYSGDVVRANDITRSPAQVGMFGEESLWLIEADPGLGEAFLNLATFNDNVLLIKPDSWTPFTSLPYADCLASFHKAGADKNSGTSNVVFVDGHVEMVKPIDSLNAMWPHPGDWTIK